ncbi:hypothetical protein [Methanobrevibacter sp.]|uniref:hypothetical protein n=1 Tax=Methanobrevibacter sp. TaxID=66852 RepID=UPI003868FBD5
MNNKIFAVFILLIFAASISAVSAFDLGDLFGAGENETVTIGGFDFNIPAGYDEESSKYSDDVLKQLEKYGLNVTGKTYMKDSTGVGIFVANFSDYELSDDEVLDIMGGNATTIKNVDGLLNFDESYAFSHVKDNCLIVITSTDKDVIGDFIIA